MKKNIVNIQSEDTLYEIAERLLTIQGTLKDLEEEAWRLRQRGAALMTEHDWDLARCPEFTVRKFDSYVGIDWKRLKVLPAFRACSGKRIQMDAPSIQVIPKKIK